MNNSLKAEILALYPEFHTVYGPYLRKDGRSIVILYDGKRRSARQLAKVKLEIKIGRLLSDDEEVDHKDGNFTNDIDSNLQVLSKTENRIKQHKDAHGESLDIHCIYCSNYIKTVFSKRISKAYCSNSCRSLHLGANQYGNKLVGYSK